HGAWGDHDFPSFVDQSGGVQLLDLTDGMKPCGVLECTDSPVLAMAFSPDGRLLAAGGRDGSVSLSEVPSLEWLAKRRALKVGWRVAVIVLIILLVVGAIVSALWNIWVAWAARRRGKRGAANPHMTLNLGEFVVGALLLLVLLLPALFLG